MNTCKLKLAGLLFVFSALAPQATNAYFTTDQTATKLDAHSVLFTITYKFGFAEREVYLPIVTERDLSAHNPSLQAGFSILDDREVSLLGSASTIILSNAEIENGRYYVPPGETASFTLLSVATFTDTELADQPKLSLLMTHLPFTMITTEDVTIPAQLNPSELQYYVTPEVAL